MKVIIIKLDGGDADGVAFNLKVIKFLADILESGVELDFDLRSFGDKPLRMTLFF